MFVYAALLACVSGWLYAHLQRFVNPTPFGINQGIEYLFMAVVGGAGSVWGAVLGATLITLLKQVLQDLLPTLLGRSGNFEIVVFGILMVLLLQRRARRRVAVARAPAAATPRPRRVPDAPPLPARERVAARGAAARRDAARKQFGGLVAVNDLSFDDPHGRDPRPDRPQRRGQEHDVQPDLAARCRSRPGDVRFRGDVDRQPSRRTRSRAAASAARSST